MTRVCLVTDELYPFTAGGIGRLLHNLIRDSLRRSPEARFLLVLPGYLKLDPQRVSAYFGDRVEVDFAYLREEWQASAEFGTEYPPPGAYTDSDWHAQSLDILRALKRLASRKLDVIEFPDYRGWAYCTLQEKLLGLDFQESLIAVRIHSTDGVLQRFEEREPSFRQLARFDLERKALLDAERVIAHLRPVADWNASFYGFDEAWKRKVTIEFPPVLEAASSGAAPEAARPARDILFVTKQQRIKQPELFIRGAATFLKARPEYAGRVVLACHPADAAYADKLRSMVPADLAGRFLFLAPGPERDAILPGSVVVLPSAHESLSLAAYEAAAAGAMLVLNGACIAFGESTPWHDGVNCHKFDGTVDGLAGALARAMAKPPPETVRWEAAPAYWLSAAGPPPAVAASVPPPLVSVVIPNYNLGRWLPETLASVASSTWDEIEVVVVDDASTEDFDHAVLERLEADAGPVRVVRNLVNRGLAASRNAGIRAARGRYVLPLDADDCIGPRFIAQAVAALEARPEYDVVVPTAGYFDSDAELAERRFADYACFIGDAPSCGLVANRMSCATSLMRRSLFDGLEYDEALDSYEDWSLYLRAVLKGRRFLVTNDVQFYYRRRPGSMITGMNPDRHLRLLERMYMSLPRPLPASVHPFALLAPTHKAFAENRQLADRVTALTPAAAKAPRHNLADAVNATVKRVPLLHPVLKATVAGLRGLAGNRAEPERPLRYEMVDAVNGALKRLPLLHPLLKATGARLAKRDGER
ncbi:MAG: glycosyltransferase [Deltaproteobacteria bacterium]